MKRRVKSLLLVGALAISMLAGCGSGDVKSDTADTSKKDTEDNASEEGDTAASVETVKIEMWGQENDVSGFEKFQKALDIYNERYPDAPLEIEFIPGGDADPYLQKLLMAADTNTLPDLFLGTCAYIDGIWETGALLDITEYIESDAEWSARFISGAFNLQEQYTGGAKYGVPYQNEFQGFILNKRLFDEQGLEIPVTWEEWLNCIEVFKEADITPIAYGATDNWSRWGFDLFFHRYGFYDNLDAILNGEMQFSEIGTAAFEKIDELAKLGAFPENVNTATYTEALELFKAGQAAIITTGSWELSSLLESEEANNFVLSWGPEFSDSEYDQKYAAKLCSWTAFCSNKVGDDPVKLERVLNYLKIMSDEEYVNWLVEEKTWYPAYTYTGDAELPELYTSMLAKIEDEYFGVGEMASYVDTSFQAAWWNACSAVITQTATPEEAAQQLDDAIELVR